MRHFSLTVYAQCAITTNIHSLLTLRQTSSDTSLSFEKLQTVPEPHSERLEKLRDMRAVILHEMSAGDPSQILSSFAHATSFTHHPNPYDFLYSMELGKRHFAEY